jgi:hypothetical protein
MEARRFIIGNVAKATPEPPGIDDAALRALDALRASAIGSRIAAALDRNRSGGSNGADRRR